MQDISLSFFIAVNSDKETIIKILKAQEDILLSLFGHNRIIIGKNNVEIKRNEDYDKKLSLTDEDAFLYYESNMYFYPYDDTLMLDEQIQLAKKICKVFVESGISSEIVAEFEKWL
ncbi:hypothetical protein IMSAGC011_03619 [Lachnospiraceae bacterium]|nr:hypothetical protein IMSAGC011_03619 [Lachnospiraceae bacterium]